VTGVLFSEQTVESVKDAIEQCLARSWDKAELTSNAERFSPERFRSEFAEAVAGAMAR
jgi:hypothetical protein